VSQALTEGIRQVVILGAGFDCRLYRLSGIDRVAAFEVDHPATLGAKLSRLRNVIRRLPGNVRYVEIDFDRQNLTEALEQRGFDRGQPSIFVWEGVTNYLSAKAVDAVLCYVAGCAAGTRVAFTYCIVAPLMVPQNFQMQPGSLVMSPSLANLGPLVLFPRSCPLISASEDSNSIGMTTRDNTDAHTLAGLQNL